MKDSDERIEASKSVDTPYSAARRRFYRRWPASAGHKSYGDLIEEASLAEVVRLLRTKALRETAVRNAQFEIVELLNSPGQHPNALRENGCPSLQFALEPDWFLA